MLRDLGDFDASAAALDECRRLDADSHPPAIRPEHILASQGELLMRRGDLDGARALFEEARELDPDIELRLGAHRARPRAQRRHLGGARTPTGTPQPCRAAPSRTSHSAACTRRSRTITVPRPVRSPRRCGSCRAPSRWCGSSSRGSSSPSPVRTRRCAQVEQALACRREGGFVEALRLAAEVAERLGDLEAATGYLRQVAKLAPDDRRYPATRSRRSRIAPPHHAQPPTDAPLPPGFEVLADAGIDAPGRARVEGVIDRFFAEKGFGFVRYGDGQTLFFHVTQCQDGAAGIEPGVAVSFILGHNPKKGKPQAEALRLEEHLEEHPE